MDRRLTPANGSVAHVALKGKVEAAAFVAPTRHMIAVPVAPLLSQPATSAPRDRELAFGEGFDVLEKRDGWAFGQATRDDYVGYVPEDVLATDFLTPTHRVIAPTYWRSEPRLKSAYEPMPLPIGAKVSVCTTHHDHCDWAEIDWPATSPDSPGSAVYVPMPQLLPLDQIATDPVAEAERYLGIPYLWAGNSGFGIDCSGLVQAALLACAIPCPGDSDLQEAAFAVASGGYKRGDLLFWKGHVAFVADPDRLIHANAHHMAVAYEPIADTISRIAAQGGGPVTSHKRPSQEAP